ncbi:associated protein 15 homolog [Seminavis robusta]|uniref:Associated protein 15 homolog n=1 Tax=Seminavis robusta TaxID=568900 RepID=A0A9N8DQ15_9STRA|nr:associated protein 15 homolog [Seminavis robusta]|eukprot:Sro203_g085690.1 associated protein 15 homolog (666) ;mRNA; f:78415-80412
MTSLASKNSMIITTTGLSNNNNVFKTSLQLQTAKPTTSSIRAGLAQAQVALAKKKSDEDDTFGYTESDPNEARYWMNHYGLGTHHYSRPQRQYAHPRKLLLKPTAQTSIVQQVVFGPAATTATTKYAPLAVVGGPRVHLYGTNAVSAFTRHLARHRAGHDSPITTTTVAADRHVQTGGHLALAANFRNDGRLLAVGTDVGEVRICDVTMRATLSTFCTPNTKLPMRVVVWFRNGQHILSGGDDGVLRVWSLSASSGSIGAGGGNKASTALLELMGHGDSIRTAILWQQPASALKNATTAAWNQLAFSGSYDHSIRVWNVQMTDDEQDEDGQEDRCLSVLSHGAPVESLLTMASTDPNVPVWLLSAGGTTVKVWNPLTGECVCTVATQHRKTITSLLPVLRAPKNTTNNTDIVPAWRVVTGSLDGCIRIHTWDSSTGKLEHIHGIQVGTATPITALAVDEKGERLAIGTTEGTVHIRQKGPSITQHKSKRPPPAGTYAFFTRGANATLDIGNNDYILGAGPSATKKRKLQKYDQCLKQFNYGEALDEALETRNPQVVVAVLEELGKRRGLKIALSSRDEESLEPLLSFLVRYVTRPRFSSVLIGVSHMLIDIYSDVAGQSELVDELFGKLRMQVRNECRMQRGLLRLLGQIDAVVAMKPGSDGGGP